MAQQFVRKGGDKQLCVIQITQDKHPMEVHQGKSRLHMHHRPRTSSEEKRRRGLYEQRKENQSRKQYSLRSKAKEQKEESDIGSSAISSMSSRNSTSAMETNEISVCAKPVSPDMKAPTEQTGNQHGDQAVNNNMGSIGDQAVNDCMGHIGDQAVINYKGSISDQAVNDYMGSVGDQSVNDYKGSICTQVDNHFNNGSNFMESCRDQADNQYRNISSNTGTRSYKHCNIGYMDNLVKNSYNRQHQQHGQETTNFPDFQHTTSVPQIVNAPNIFSFSGYQCATMIPLLYLPNSLSFSGLYLMIPLFR